MRVLDHNDIITIVERSFRYEFTPEMLARARLASQSSGNPSGTISLTTETPKKPSSLSASVFSISEVPSSPSTPKTPVPMSRGSVSNGQSPKIVTTVVDSEISTSPKLSPKVVKIDNENLSGVTPFNIVGASSLGTSVVSSTDEHHREFDKENVEEVNLVEECAKIDEARDVGEIEPVDLVESVSAEAVEVASESVSVQAADAESFSAEVVNVSTESEPWVTEVVEVSAETSIEAAVGSTIAEVVSNVPAESAAAAVVECPEESEIPLNVGKVEEVVCESLFESVDKVDACDDVVMENGENICEKIAETKDVESVDTEFVVSSTENDIAMVSETVECVMEPNEAATELLETGVVTESIESEEKVEFMETEAVVEIVETESAVEAVETETFVEQVETNDVEACVMEAEPILENAVEDVEVVEAEMAESTTEMGTEAVEKVEVAEIPAESVDEFADSLAVDKMKTMDCENIEAHEEFNAAESELKGVAVDTETVKMEEAENQEESGVVQTEISESSVDLKVEPIPEAMSTEVAEAAVEMRETCAEKISESSEIVEEAPVQVESSPVIEDVTETETVEKFQKEEEEVVPVVEIADGDADSKVGVVVEAEQEEIASVEIESVAAETIVIEAVGVESKPASPRHSDRVEEVDPCTPGPLRKSTRVHVTPAALESVKRQQSPQSSIKRGVRSSSSRSTRSRADEAPSSPRSRSQKRKSVQTESETDDGDENDENLALADMNTSASSGSKRSKTEPSNTPVRRSTRSRVTQK